MEERRRPEAAPPETGRLWVPDRPERSGSEDDEWLRAAFADPAFYLSDLAPERTHIFQSRGGHEKGDRARNGPLDAPTLLDVGSTRIRGSKDRAARWGCRYVSF